MSDFNPYSTLRAAGLQHHEIKPTVEAIGKEIATLHISDEDRSDAFRNAVNAFAEQLQQNRSSKGIR